MLKLFYGLAVFVGLTIAGSQKAIGQEGQSSARVVVLPCIGPCGVMQWGVLAIKRNDGSGTRMLVPTSMKSVNLAYRNAFGNIAILGRLENELPVVEIVNEATGKVVDEFWASKVGLSPDVKFVAFTRFVAPHGASSIYDDAMVYVLDIGKYNLAPEGFATLPSSAVPVFPASLVELGPKFLLSKPEAQLYKVVSGQFTWRSDRQFEFLAAGPHYSNVRPAALPLRLVSLTAVGQAGWSSIETPITLGVVCEAAISQRVDIGLLSNECPK